jgi:MarR family transcriptional regulator, 2-MHQ and catechol-resistance regulon repressor
VKIEEELKSSKFGSSKHKAIVNVMFTEVWINNRLRAVFKNYKITPQQYNVLRILRGAYPEFMNPKAIKDVMIDKNPDLTRLCDRLLSMGLIDRCINTENKRMMDIQINQKGLEMLEKMEPPIKNIENNLIGLTEEEAETLSQLLDKLRD